VQAGDLSGAADLVRDWKRARFEPVVARYAPPPTGSGFGFKAQIFGARRQVPKAD